MSYIKKIKIIHIIIIVFFFTNLLFLTAFPFIHSDEAWLSGLSRNMLERKDLSITEPFFNLYPRHPHAIKLLFHLIQISFIKSIGYNIFTFRLISLIAGTISLYLFYKLTKKFTDSPFLTYMSTIMMGIDIQFIYASHFARQEALILLIFLLAIYYFWDKYNYNKKSIYKDIIMGLILGTAIGIHPNSFIISLPFVLIYTYLLLIDKKINFPNYLAFGCTLGLIALSFIFISFKFDSNFLYNYASYGQGLGVFNSILTKINGLVYFYKKLFYGVSGTYYTPAIKFQFTIFAIAIIYTILQIISGEFIHRLGKQINYNVIKKGIPLVLLLLGINLGYTIIGRYNQTGIIFIFPISYLLILNIISTMKKKYAYIITVLIIIILAFNTVSTLIVDSYYNYDDYLSEIEKVIDKDKQVLANLNSEYYFNNGKLLDYRNLTYLKENNITFSEYIANNKIEYIIYLEEMDYIYKNRPVWNILYGNIFPYYQEMQDFLNKECKEIHSFTNKTYGIRIARYIAKKDWNIKIYRVGK